MRDRLLAPVRGVLLEWTHPGSPDEVGLGVALGLTLGLVPVENLTSAALAVLLLALRTNVTAAAAAVPVGLVAGWAGDGWLDQVGRAALTADVLRPAWEGLFSVPGTFATRLNNTVVLGSLVVGVASVGPVWLVTRTAWSALGRRLGPVAARSAFWKAVAGPDLAASWGGR